MSTNKKLPYSINLSSQSYLINPSLIKTLNYTIKQKLLKPKKQKTNSDLCAKNSSKNKIINSMSKLNTTFQHSIPTTARVSQNNELSKICIFKEFFPKKVKNYSKIFNKTMKNFNFNSQKIIQDLDYIFDENKIKTPLNTQTKFQFYNHKKNNSAINYFENKILTTRNNLSKSTNFNRIDDSFNKNPSKSIFYNLNNNKNTKSLLDFVLDNENNDYLDLHQNSNKLINKLNRYTKRLKYVQQIKPKETNINKEIIKSMKNGIFSYKSQHSSPTYKNIEINKKNLPINNILLKNAHFNSNYKKFNNDVGNDFYIKSINDLMRSMHESKKTEKFIFEMRVNSNSHSNSKKRSKFSYNGNCDNDEEDKFFENKKIKGKNKILGLKKNQKLNCLLSKIPKHPIYSKKGYLGGKYLNDSKEKDYFFIKKDEKYVFKYDDPIMPVNNTLF